MAPRILLPVALLLVGNFLRASPIAAEAASKAPGSPAPTAVHELGQSYMFLRVHDDSIVVRVEITVADVERVLEFGWGPEEVTLAQVQSRLDSVRAYVEPRFSLSAGGDPLPIRFDNVDVRFMEIADYVVLTYMIEDLDEIPDEVEVHYSVLLDVDNLHRNMLLIEHNWKTATFNNQAFISLIFSPRNRQQVLDLTSSSILRGVPQDSSGSGCGTSGSVSTTSSFSSRSSSLQCCSRSDGEWKPVTSFRRALINIVTIVTFFTIAHSVTLSLAALDVVRLSSRLVESIIAGSIAVAAWANLVPKLNVKEWSIAFVFGLFHGFGFASVLGDIGMGREHLVLSLLGFNVGVELGQIAVIMRDLPRPLLLRATRLYRWILRFGSWFLIAIALLWVFERTFDFTCLSFP